ncbi:MAG: alpha/beta fold hydrolase [Halieaceae bacterium]
MTRAIGRRRWIFLLLVTTLLAAATWFYRFYFSSTDAAIRHAEAFLFRRMTVAQLAGQGDYRFFYTTNREQGKVDGTIAERFGSGRTEQLKFGSFDATFEPSLGLGMLINPTEWFQNEEIHLKDVSTIERAVFVSQLREQLEKSPHRGLLVVVHGFREAYESALRKTAFLGHVLDINAPVLLFDWPGNQGSSLRGYRQAREVAKASGAELAATLKLIVEEVQPQRLWLVANSMGGQVVADAFGKLSTLESFTGDPPEIEHVVMTAPDISTDEFDARFREEILSLAEHLTVYVSSNDRALLVSRLVNREARRGESTLSPDQFDEAARVAGLMRPDDEVIALVDVTPVNRTRNFHNFSLETPEYFDDLFLRLSNETIPRSRLIYQIETEDGRVYSVLTRGR